jgi:hypothetical protein
MEGRRIHPEVDKHVRNVSQKTKFPIRNIAQLMKALGGDDAPIEFEGWQAPAGRLKQFIPDHYFPVVSEEDLVRKAEDLRALHMGVSSPGMDAPPQPKEEMAEPLRAEFERFSWRDLDLATVTPPYESEADGGIARLPD